MLHGGRSPPVRFPHSQGAPMIPVAESHDSYFEKLCAEQFNEGQHRTVHDAVGLPNVVMKVARDSHISNWCEYLVSTSLEGQLTQVKVAKVLSISASGKFLIMERLPDLDRSLDGVVLPSWLNDKKPSAFGVDRHGQVKIRDYGLLNIGNLVGTEAYVYEEDRVAVPRVVAGGFDSDYERLMGSQIGIDGARTVYDVIGHPDKVLKVCNLSHRENAVEWIIHCALLSINAEELTRFASFEASRTGKFILTDKLKGVPFGFAGALPDLPTWLPNTANVLGVDVHGNAMIRRWADIGLGPLLARAPTTVIERVPST
jgi:hypothetical protein